MNQGQLTKSAIFANMRNALSINYDFDFALVNDVKVVAQITLLDNYITSCTQFSIFFNQNKIENFSKLSFDQFFEHGIKNGRTLLFIA